MKKLFITTLFSIFTISAFSQFKSKEYNQLSLEGTIGYGMPLTNISVSGEGTFASIPSVNLGARYMFNQNFGTKFAFNNNNFREKSVGSSQYRFELEGYYNIGNLFNLTYKTYESVALFLHAGVGVGITTSQNPAFAYGDEYERHGVVIVGLSPRFRLSEKLSLITDVNYNMILKQHIHYDGQEIQPFSKKGINTSHLTVSVGLCLNLGKRRYHADWY
jgi:OmpA-OmpF porin, OOP family